MVVWLTQTFLSRTSAPFFYEKPDMTSLQLTKPKESLQNLRPLRSVFGHLELLIYYS